MKSRKDVLKEAGLTEEELRQVEKALEQALEREDDAHERAAARARLNDFEDTDGKDWT